MPQQIELRFNSNGEYGNVRVVSNKKNYVRKIRNAFKNSDTCIDHLEIHIPTGEGRSIRRVLLKEPHQKEFFYGALKFKKRADKEYEKTYMVYKEKPLVGAEPIGYGEAERGGPFLITRVVEGVPLSLLSFESLDKEELRGILLEAGILFARLHNPPTILHGDTKLGNIILSPNNESRPLLTLIDWEKAQRLKQKTHYERYGFDLLIFISNACYLKMITDEKTASLFIDAYRTSLKDREIADNITEILKEAGAVHTKIKMPPHISRAITQPLIRMI